ncbi:unnamed protein product [Coregonus sp. 'balchen']|nr:unnamed protein product [Coregonus sp. 'balchen']
MEKYCLDSLSNISEQHGMFCNITLLNKMRTPTNLYLFSLAVSDLLVLFFGMPLEIYDLWQNYPFPFGEGVCYFKIFLFETVCFASILNVTVLSVERYIAVVHPLKIRYVATNKHAKCVISAVWVVSLVCAIPNTSLHGICYLNLPEKVAESAICSLIGTPWIYNLVILITTACFYIVPMTVISGLYLGIGIKLGRERHLSRGTMRKNCSANISWRIHVERGCRRQVTKMPEDTTARKDSTPSAKILLVPSGPVPNTQAKPRDHNSLTPL